MAIDNEVTVLDLRGLICPLPVLKTRKALSRLHVGERLSVQATDPMSDIDLPHFCQEHGHRLVEKTTKDDIRIFLIEKGG
ncbi:MAG: sulfurtransferase TusA family protein [Stappiaceae bacterium]